jgi:signal transduction histidine kinase
MRILQEAFTNIIKHTHATEIRVATGVEDDYVTVTVTDYGRGCPTRCVARSSSALKLAGTRTMRVRV